MPGVPCVIQKEAPHPLDYLDEDEPHNEKYMGGIVKEGKYDYSGNEAAIHAHLKAGVDKRRGKDIKIN